MAKVDPVHDVEIGIHAPEIINAIIEIPRDSHLKYEIDKDTGLLKLDRFLHSAVHYPGDYGYVPQTLWEDGDPLDIIVITNRPVYPLTLVEVRVIGAIRMIDDQESDDKILAVYNCDPRFAEWNDITDVPKHIIKEYDHFFRTYKELQGKICDVKEFLDKHIAYQIIRKSQKLYKEASSSGKQNDNRTSLL